MAVSRIAVPPFPEVPKAVMYEGGVVRPVPDPTDLTSLAIDKAINGLDARITTRLEAIDKGISLLQDHANRSPSVSVIEERLKALRELVLEMFRAVSAEFQLRDSRAAEAAKDTSKAVDAALQAAEKAVGKQQESNALAIDKSEASVIKQIDRIIELTQQGFKAYDGQISDLKDRTSAVESRSPSPGSPVMVVVMGVALIIAVVVIAVLAFVPHR